MFLSILIPNLGFNNLTVRCLESVADEQFSCNYDFEVLICDQSNEQDKHKLCEFVSRFRNFKVISIDFPNVLHARKKLIEHASGDYLFFIDSDDYVDKFFIKTLRQAILNHSFPDLLITSYFQNDHNGCHKNNDILSINNNFKEFFYCSDLFNTLWRKVFKKSIYNHDDIKDLESINGDDWIISYSLVKNSKSIVFDNGVCFYHYCNNNNSLTNTMTLERFQKSFCLKDCFIKEFKILNKSMLFSQRMIKFLGFSFICKRVQKNKKDLRQAFMFVREKLITQFNIKISDVKGAKYKILYLLLKFRMFFLYKLLLIIHG